MTVPPCSQLTRRMVPASTLRRNDATIIGSTTSTPMTIAAMRMSVFMDGRMKEVVRSPVGNADDTAMARGVDAGNADEITGANPCAARAVVRGECGEQLHDLAVDVERDEPLAVGVEAHHGARVVLDRALERGGGSGFETEQHPPERPDEQPFERGGGERRRAGAPRLTERHGEQPTGTEADEQREQHARGEERLQPGGAVPGAIMHVVAVLAVARMGGVPVRRVSAVHGVARAGVGVSEVSGVAMSDVTMPTMPTVSVMSHVSEAADRHRSEPGTTQR